MNCDFCNFEAKNKAGLAAHKRSHKPKEEETKPEPTSTDQSHIPTVLLEMKGWKALSQNDTYYATDELGKRIGTFGSAKEAIQFIENSSRWVKTR